MCVSIYKFFTHRYISFSFKIYLQIHTGNIVLVIERYQNNTSVYFRSVNKLQHSTQMTYIFRKECTIAVCYLGKLVFLRMKDANFRRLHWI